MRSILGWWERSWDGPRLETTIQRGLKKNSGLTSIGSDGGGGLWNRDRTIFADRDAVYEPMTGGHVAGSVDGARVDHGQGKQVTEAHRRVCGRRSD